MKATMRQFSPYSLALAAVFVATPALAQRDADGDDGPGRAVTEITVQARRLDAARENINSGLGASVYALTNDTVESRPGGETTTISQILLQAPGITQDASGQLRLRQSQGGLQYRINNVILPDGLTDPGDTLSARLASKVELVTGALPAQYGLQAGGVVNITTKDGVYLAGGQAELYGGAHGTIQPAFEYGGSAGSLNYFASGQYQRSSLGLASPDGSARPAHDRTTQGEGLLYLDRLIGAQDRVSLILSASDERFQIPGSLPQAATQRSANRFAVVSLLHTTDRFTLQISGFLRSSLAVLDTSDAGDVAWFGYGTASRESANSAGGQIEMSYEPAEAHTLRGGAVVTSSLYKGASITQAWPVDDAGVPTSTTPLVLGENSHQRRRIDSAFVQDEWRFADRWTLNLGGRIDHIVDIGNQTSLSPRASAVWHPDADATIHIGYAHYVLPAPIEGSTESPANLAGTSARLPGLTSHATQAETDDYYAIGAQRKLGDVTLGVDAYWRAARNLIDDAPLAGSYRTLAFNYTRGRLRGIELTATYAAQRLSAWGNLAVAGAQGQQIASNEAYFSQATLDYAAAHPVSTNGAQTLSISGGVSYRWDHLRLSSDVLVGSGLPRTAAGGAPNGSHLPAYAQANLSAVWRVAEWRGFPLDLRADAINLFDARYALRDGSGLLASPSAWGARRGLFVGIEQGF
jgi:outer membrane cobalamin receptor